MKLIMSVSSISQNVAMGHHLEEVKEKFLDPLNDISSIYYQPKNDTTIALLMGNLAKLQH